MSMDAFEQGKQAFRHNHPMSACEYPVGSTLRAEWMAGWTASRNAEPGQPQRPAPAGTAAAATGEQPSRH